MKLNRGFQELLMDFNLHNDDFEILFMSGTMPTEAEVMEAATSNSDNLTYADYMAANKFTAWLQSRGDTLLAYQIFPNYRYFIQESGQTKTSYSLDMTSNVENAMYQAEGTISYLVLFPLGHHTYNHANSSQVKSLMFFSVGLPGSGADVELTSVEFKEGDNIRMNNISLSI